MVPSAPDSMTHFLPMPLKLSFITCLIGSLTAFPLCNQRTTFLSALPSQVPLGFFRSSNKDPLKNSDPSVFSCSEALALLCSLHCIVGPKWFAISGKKKPKQQKGKWCLCVYARKWHTSTSFLKQAESFRVVVWVTAARRWLWVVSSRLAYPGYREMLSFVITSKQSWTNSQWQFDHTKIRICLSLHSA